MANYTIALFNVRYYTVDSSKDTVTVIGANLRGIKNSVWCQKLRISAKALILKIIVDVLY